MWSVQEIAFSVQEIAFSVQKIAERVQKIAERVQTVSGQNRKKVQKGSKGFKTLNPFFLLANNC